MPIFKTEIDEALPILRERAFGQLVVSTSGAPLGVHMPFLAVPDGEDGLRIELHLARRNPILEHIGEGCQTLLMCEAGDAYISPDWYNSVDRVPTWAYTTVHLTGTARVQPMAETLDHVDRLSEFFEQQLLPKIPWTSAKMDQQKLSALLKAIVVVSLEVSSIVIKKKDLCEKNAQERLGAIAGLAGRNDPRAAAVAKLIAETLT